MIQIISLFGQHSWALLLALVAPSIAVRRARSPWLRRLYVAVHVVGMLLLMGLLFGIQWRFGLDRYVRSSSAVMRGGWLPIVAGTLYALAWSSWYLMRLVRQPGDTLLHSDIGTAWNTAKDRLARAGIDLRRTPLFLVVGKPTGGVHQFFSAAELELTVPPTPVDDDAPLRLCGNADALFLCCEDVSLLSEFSNRLAAQEAENRRGSGGSGKGMQEDEDPAHRWEPTMASADAEWRQDGGGLAGGTMVQPRTAKALAPAATALERSVEKQLAAIESHLRSATEVLQPSAGTDHLVHLEVESADRISQRLAYLCRLIIEDREPYCPLNGIVVLVPIAATDRDDLADHVGMRIERDLQTILNTTECGTSVQVILCGLENCQGARELLARFPQTQRRRRLGATIPAAPISEAGSQEMLIDKTCEWLCESLFPPLVSRLYMRNCRDEVVDQAMTEGNRNLYSLVQAMRLRRTGLSRMLRRAVAFSEGQLRVRGCYITATGSDSLTCQAFTSGVMPVIIAAQNEVRWIPRRRRHDAVQWALTILGYTVLAIASATTVALLFR